MPENSPTHEYLKDKKINSNFNARVNEKGVLFVPAWNSKRQFVGGQHIFRDPETNRWAKRYTKGIEKLGSFCPFGDIAKAKFIYIAEGFATAASIYMVFKNDSNIAVVCVWDTSNILPGAKAIREVNPKCNIIFAADKDVHDDPKHNNKGEKVAKFASQRTSNSVVRTVRFREKNAAWSDYNDLHQFEGLENLIPQLIVKPSDFTEIIPLGIDNGYYFLYSTESGQILKWKATSFTPTNYTLIASPVYWGERYGFSLDSNGDETNKPNWQMVTARFAEELRACGIFSIKKLRGLGVWIEGESVIINNGKNLIINNEIVYNNVVSNKTDFFYEISERGYLKEELLDPTISISEIPKVIGLLNFKNKSDYLILSGWIYAAQCFSNLKWRPHIWITGSRGSGKSTILEYIHKLIPFSLISDNATASGIRQKIGNDSLAIIYDEAEPSNVRDKAKIYEVITMARQSSSNNNAQVLRGTAEGRSISYNTNTCFCMGSIQIPNLNSADESRFFKLEMMPNDGQSQEQFLEISKKFNIIHKLSNQFLLKTVKDFNIFQLNIKVVFGLLRAEGISPRLSDQLSPIIAGFWGYNQSKEVTKDFFNWAFDELDLKNSDFLNDNSLSESEKFLDVLFETPITDMGENLLSVISTFRNKKGNDINRLNKSLANLGLKIINRTELAIHPTHIRLANEMERYGYQNLDSILMRLPNTLLTTKNGKIQVRINGKNRKCHIITLEEYFKD